MKTPTLPAWQPVLLAALAGALGWGIRGQYGHETGAMIAGLLVSLVLVFLFCPAAPALPAARAAAWCTVAIGIGGAMTYGQTVGLTHDPALVGNGHALAWGMLGLAVKGGVWIGFAGVWLGMGLSGIRYRPLELLGLLLALLPLFVLGVWLLNSPYDPDQRLLPRFYFSDSWLWEPEAELKPRRETWGGLGCALLAVVGYATWVRGDRLARNLALWGLLGGALGFPLGQCVQAFHAWNPGLFAAGWLHQVEPTINWWNFMETTFGATFGAVIGWGTWLNRKYISLGDKPLDTPLGLGPELGLGALHATLLVGGGFFDLPIAELYQEYSLILVIVPIVAVSGGRVWPWLLLLPITLIPIAGKTVDVLVQLESVWPPVLGWTVLLILPLAIAITFTLWADRKSAAGSQAHTVLRPVLLVVTWIYFGLNFAFFRFPWPWSDWTSRTPNALVFTVCALGLTAGALLIHRSASPRARQSCE